MKKLLKNKWTYILLSLLTTAILCLSLGLNFVGGGRTDLALTTNTTSADGPTNTGYWTDTATQTALGVDFTNYTLSGSGTEIDPYQINSETDLAFLSWTIYNNKAYNGNVTSSYYFYSGKYFKQTKDLDLSAYYWQPIGISYLRDGTSTSRYFSGNYDGGGHTVSGLYTPAGSTSAYSEQGLFGYVYGRSTQEATISNVGVIDSFIQGYQDVGGVVGHAGNYSTITNCYNTGSVTGSGSSVGGVAGDAGSTTITNCYNTGSVTGSGSSVGGVAGYASGTITNCYNTGAVTGSDNYVGGVVGYAYRYSSTSKVTITNCYNTGSITGSGDSVGGVVGYAYRSTISNCYNTGTVTGSGDDVGGVVGYAYSNSTISNTYYGGECTLTTGIGSGSGTATKIDAPVKEWAKNKAWYTDLSNWNNAYPWDFVVVWEFHDNTSVNNGFPILQRVKSYWTDSTTQTALGVDFTNYTLSGTGTETDPYLIKSETDLAFLSWTIYTGNAYNGNVSSSYYFYSGKYFKQTKNLDLSAYYWQPIGILYLRDGTSAQRYFSGNYDGGGHTISGLYTPAGSGNAYSYQGLFGYVYGYSSTQATISNVGVIYSFIQGYRCVGGVVGTAELGIITITNCYNTGSVTGNDTYVGGVAGYASGTITNCYNTGSVTSISTRSNSSVGGVAGYASGTITNCYNTGAVTGSYNYVGGVVGSASSSTISNCYNTGAVTGSYNYVGGVVGSTSSSTITNCYNTGSVEGSGNYVGGVVGRADSSSTITNCYNTNSVEGSGSNVGGVVGRADSSSTITNCYNTGAVEGSGNYVGGVVGEASNSTISNTYYGGECTLLKGIGSGSGSATKIDAPVEEWAKNKAWYTNSSKWNSSYPWNFDTVWEFVKAPDYISNGYPVLQGIFPPAGTEIIYWTDDVVQEAFDVDFTNYTLSGSGTAESPYQINSETDLAFLSWTIYTDNVYGGSGNKTTSGSSNYFYSNKYFKQTKNLDMSAYYWQPIGIDYLRDGSSCKRYFAGSYIGCDFIVSGLYTPAMPEGLTAEEQNGYSNQGLFGVVSSTAADLARISNIYIKDSYFQGLDSIGSVVGCLYSHNVTNCYNFSTVKATGKHVGGIVGYTSSSSGRISISNCYNFSSIEGVDYVAGIVGYSGSNIDLQNNYNIGLIKGSGSVGGIAGYAWSNSTINNCFSNGTISAVSNVGGIVGATGNVTISGCGVETTQISGNSNVGVLVGYGNSSTTITNCYGIVGVDIDFASVGTYDNCVWITNVDGVVNKYYHGNDFSAFAWFNPNSCPIPKSLSSLGQFWTGDITPTLTASSEWQEVA